jgi:hypothetical protein
MFGEAGPEFAIPNQDYAASPPPHPAPLRPATLPLAGEGENPCGPALFPTGTRPHIGHCQGMVEAWVGSFVGFSAPAFAKS